MSVFFIKFVLLLRMKDMAFIDLVKQRRSIRKYEAKPVEEEKLQAIVKAALMAPSSKRCQPWHFVVVDDAETIAKLSVCREAGSKFLEGAPAAIIVLADTTLSDVWTEDASIAAAYMQLQAEDLGLGSCWVQVRNRVKSETQTTEEYIKELVNAPENLSVECILGVGYKGEDKNPFDESRLKLDRLIKNRF